MKYPEIYSQAELVEVGCIFQDILDKAKQAAF